MNDVITWIGASIAVMAAVGSVALAVKTYRITHRRNP